MDMRVFASGLLFALCAVMIPAMAQDAGQAAKVKYVSLVGTVEKVDAAGKVLAVKPDKADQTPVKFDDKTQFLRLAAGETDTKKATRAAAPSCRRARDPPACSRRSAAASTAATGHTGASAPACGTNREWSPIGFHSTRPAASASGAESPRACPRGASRG